MKTIEKMFNKETSFTWEKNGEFNRIFVRTQINYAHDRLERRGFLFLNEVYQALGMPMTANGQVCGWKVTDLKPGDHFISFITYEDKADLKLIFHNVSEDITDCLVED